MAGKNGWILSATKPGIVGAKLLYPDDSVQHCGVVIGVGGFAGHILTLSDRNEVGYFGKLQAVQNVCCYRCLSDD